VQKIMKKIRYTLTYIKWQMSLIKILFYPWKMILSVFFFLSTANQGLAIIIFPHKIGSLVRALRWTEANKIINKNFKIFFLCMWDKWGFG
jgi:hypothetical protein